MRAGSLLLVVSLAGCGHTSPATPDGQPDGNADATPDVDGSNSGCAVSGAGAIDKSFGDDGVVTFFGLHPGAVVANAVVIDAASRIVIVGYTTRVARSCFVARLLPNGAPDPAFGSHGVRYQTVEDEAVCWYHDVVIQADGKIVAVGDVNGHVNPRAFVARYLSDGTLDSQFGVDGLVVSDQQHTTAMAAAIDSDQRILVTGSAGSGVNGLSTFYTRRYLGNGTLDASFGDSGVAQSVFTGSSAGAYGLGIRAGKIVVVGSASIGPPESTFAVARYTSSGALDASFGVDGSIVAFGDDSGAIDARFDATGQLVVLGSSGAGGILIRLTDEGIPDVTFGSGTGSVVDAVAYGSLTASPQDASLVVGTSVAGAMVLARFTPTGELDSTFGPDGHAAAAPLAWRQDGGDVAVQPGGGIVVVGGYGDLTSYDMFAARYCP